MVKKTSEFIRGRILGVYHFLKSSRKISKNLAQEGISVCRRTVNNIINAKEKKTWKKSSSKKQSKNPGKLQRKSTQVGRQKFCAQSESAIEVQLRCGLFLKTLRWTTRFSWEKCWFQSGKDISRLYPDEERKVILPMNGARAFFHPSVVQWLETNEIKYVPARHWPTNLSDLSPMEYRILEIFEKFL